MQLFQSPITLISHYTFFYAFLVSSFAFILHLLLWRVGSWFQVPGIYFFSMSVTVFILLPVFLLFLWGDIPGTILVLSLHLTLTIALPIYAKTSKTIWILNKIQLAGLSKITRKELLSFEGDF